MLFLASAFAQAPGTLFIAGILAYEVKVIGRENRGMFSGIQRQVVGLLAAGGAFPLTYLYTLNPLYLWVMMLITSITALGFAIALPRFSDSDHQTNKETS